MLVFSGILSFCLLGVIVYFAISPKSSRLLRLVAIIALGVITLTILICGIIIIKGPGEEVELIPILPDPGAVPVKKENRAVGIVILLVFLAVLALIILKAYKDQKKQLLKEKKNTAPQLFDNSDDLDDLYTEANEKKDDDDSFDLGLN